VMHHNGSIMAQWHLLNALCLLRCSSLSRGYRRKFRHWEGSSFQAKDQFSPYTGTQDFPTCLKTCLKDVIALSNSLLSSLGILSQVVVMFFLNPDSQNCLAHSRA
jgi:hypothetical protein